ncbi:30S ribosomal protein S17e [Candidatus Woesearchaeota archaeon]|nr:30S ribosomal protein S17e [Candidatus Woesearchaeota archaeon]
MGRIKTKLIKRVTHKLFSDHAQEFKTTFDENKEIVQKFAEFPSKKIRNVIAGYVTRLVKNREEI